MSNRIPRTPFSTGLSGSARLTEMRLKNIFSGPKKRPPVLFLALMFSVCIFCGNLVSCNVVEVEEGDAPNPASSSQEGTNADAQLNEMLLGYLRAAYDCTAYLPEDTPAQPQEGDYRLDSAVLLGTTELDTEPLGLYEVQTSFYSQRVISYSQHAGKMEWLSPDPTYLVFRMETDGTPSEPLLKANYYTEGMPVGDTIRQAVWSLYDLEVCLFRDGLSNPIGPGNWVWPMFLDMEVQTEVFEEGTIYQPGDFWENWTADGGAETGGISALRYYNSENSQSSVMRLETRRTDMYTPRGIRVGSTREEVMAAYPGLLSDEKNWEWAYPDDYLWYCSNADGLGPHLYFFFVDDVVYMIQMVDLFN